MNGSSSGYLLFVRLPLVVLIVATASMGVFAKRGFLDFRRMLRQTEELQAKIEGAQKTRAELESSIERLRTDATEQEKVIRTRLGYVKPDETIVEFE